MSEYVAKHPSSKSREKVRYCGLWSVATSSLFLVLSFLLPSNTTCRLDLLDCLPACRLFKDFKVTFRKVQGDGGEKNKSPRKEEKETGTALARPLV